MCTYTHKRKIQRYSRNIRSAKKKKKKTFEEVCHVMINTAIIHKYC